MQHAGCESWHQEARRLVISILHEWTKSSERKKHGKWEQLAAIRVVSGFEVMAMATGLGCRVQGQGLIWNE